MPTFIRCPFHPRVTELAHKRPWSFCQKFRWQVTSKHIPLTQRSLSGLIMPLSRHSVGTYRETSSQATHRGTLTHSSQLAEPLWTDPGLKSGISVRELISLFSFFLFSFLRQAGNELSNILQKSSHARKKPAPPHQFPVLNKSTHIQRLKGMRQNSLSASFQVFPARPFEKVHENNRGKKNVLNRQ